jgi:hypothetical protein
VHAYAGLTRSLAWSKKERRSQRRLRQTEKLANDCQNYRPSPIAFKPDNAGKTSRGFTRTARCGMKASLARRAFCSARMPEFVA